MRLSISKPYYFLIFICLVFSKNSKGDTDPTELPLFTIDQLEYQGAFRLPANQLGESNANWANGTIAYNHRNHSLFFVGHNQHQAIAEFSIPELVITEDINNLKYAHVIQPFTRILNRLKKNPEKQNQITGLLSEHGRLIINTIRYYDASAKAKDTTIVINNSSKLSDVEYLEFFQLEDGAKAAGWISKIPKQWQRNLNFDLLVGHGNGKPINSRLSIGPSAFGTNLRHVINADIRQGKISTAAFQLYSVKNPLSNDLLNNELNNKILTELSRAAYGFIVPNTRTYMVLGRSGGHESGIGYKLKRESGENCPGFCTIDPNDHVNYYWLFDIKNWLNVINGNIEKYNIRPYSYGKLTTFYNTDENFFPISGASYDEEKDCLFITLDKADTSAGAFKNPPLILAYSLKTKNNMNCNKTN